ncbi:MAG: hypothetical protein K9G62_03200 [Alphaproteobacteria bacterium]|nr:hypothetical protein [Alphaproteobacteria bacterium]
MAAPKYILALIAACLSLSACGLTLPTWSGTADDSPIALTQAEEAVHATSAPLELRPGGSLGALGLNLDTYFEGSLNEQDRMSRMETVLSVMQKDLRILALDAQNRSPSPPVFAVRAEGDRDAAGNVLPTAGSAFVTGVRAGEHPDRMRLVFDLSAKTPYTADLDNAEKILVVELPEAGWQSSATTGAFGKNSVFGSYKVDPYNNGRGRIFVMQLRRETKILSQNLLPGLSKNTARLVIDVQK